MRLFQIDVPVYATLYVWAESAVEARAQAVALRGHDVSMYIDAAFPTEAEVLNVGSAMTFVPLADDDQAHLCYYYYDDEESIGEEGLA